MAGRPLPASSLPHRSRRAGAIGKERDMLRTGVTVIALSLGAATAASAQPAIDTLLSSLARQGFGAFEVDRENGQLEGRGPSRHDRARAHLRRRDRQAAQGRGRPARRPRRPARRPDRSGRRPGRRPGRRRDDAGTTTGTTTATTTAAGAAGATTATTETTTTGRTTGAIAAARVGAARGAGATTMARTTTTTETRPRGTGRSARAVRGFPLCGTGLPGDLGEAAAGSGRCDDDR